MSRALARVCGVFVLCAIAGCDLNEKQVARDREAIAAASDVNVLLSASPDHAGVLVLTVANASDRVMHVLEVSGEPVVDVLASQGRHNVRLKTRASRVRDMMASYAPTRRSIPPNANVQYSLDLSADYVDWYVDGSGHQGTTLQHLSVFDHKQPVDVWVTIPDPDSHGVSAVNRKSNSVSLRLDQW